MPITVLTASWALTHFIPSQPHEVDTVIIFNLQMKELKYIEAKESCPL